MLVPSTRHSFHSARSIAQWRQLLRANWREFPDELNAVPWLGRARRAESVRSGGTRGIGDSEVHLDRLQMLVGAVLVQTLYHALELAVARADDPREGRRVRGTPATSAVACGVC